MRESIGIFRMFDTLFSIIVIVGSLMEAVSSPTMGLMNFFS